MTLFPKATASGIPGVWWRFMDPVLRHDCVVLSCPRCGTAIRLERDPEVVDARGAAVTGLLVCPLSRCDWRDQGRLEGYVEA